MLMTIEQEDFGSNGVVDFFSDFARADDTSFNVNPKLTTGQREELISLLHTYSDVFADNPKRPSMAIGVKQVIDTGNAQPVKQKLYPVAPSVEGEIMRQVNEMLSNGICRPSNSPWSSRVLLVTKRDGSRRFCVDFRELNRVTLADSYPMPHPRDILDRMHGDSYYSFLDGASAYWAIEIDEEDKYKTSFVTPKDYSNLIGCHLA